MNKESRILVTGAKGFLGTYVCDNLESKGYLNVIKCENNRQTNGTTRMKTEREFACDLRNREDVQALIRMSNPDVVIHLAARVGGIGANKEKPGTFIYDNLMMGVNLIECCKEVVDKFVLVGTVCSYPKYAQVPFEERCIWDGYPEETNAPYGIAKKTLTVMLNAYREQYGLNGITVIPVNMYGPGDNFDPKTSHVIPALIRKIAEAGKHNKVTIWGTGNASREFLHVKDAARAIVMATENYNKPDIVNIGTYDEIKISSLVQTLRDIMLHEGELFYDKEKPDGQPRRCLLTAKALKEFGFKAEISLMDGLTETVNWYMSQQERSNG